MAFAMLPADAALLRVPVLVLARNRISFLAQLRSVTLNDAAVHFRNPHNGIVGIVVRTTVINAKDFNVARAHAFVRVGPEDFIVRVEL